MILLPINLEHFHWFLVCADLTKNTIYIIDSMNPREEDAKEHGRHFKKFL